MNKNANVIIGLAFVCGAGLIPSAHAAIKCWTNSEGVRECGNAIPPEYAQKETSTINKQGLTVEVQKRALTEAERVADEQRKKEEEARVAEEKRQRDERVANDRVLLSTFANEQDIVMARDRKIAALKDNIELTNLSLSKLQGKMDEYRKRAANQERSGKPIPAELKEDMAAVGKQIEGKQGFIRAKQGEINALNAKYAQDLQRFRELMQQRGQ